MALRYHDENRLPPWVATEWKHDAYTYESTVRFGIRCADGPVILQITMPEEFGMRTITRRKILQDMIEQLTVQLAKATLEAT